MICQCGAVRRSLEGLLAHQKVAHGRVPYARLVPVRVARNALLQRFMEETE